MTFKAVDGGIIPDGDQKEKMLANFMAPKFLKLRINAQVMLIKNVDDTLVNGSMGRVVKFMDALEYAGDPAVEATGVIGNQKAEGSGAGKKAAVSTGTQKVYPVVEFMLPNGGHRTVMVTADVFKVELPNGECQVSRTQVRLRLRFTIDRSLISNSLASIDSFMGDEYSQVPRPDLGTSESRPRQGLRKGPSIRCPIASYFP
jgi:ATP-dependent DNA helicase PIF1